MNAPADRPLLSELRAELGSMTSELREMAMARWELARLEIEADLLSTKRLVTAWLVAAIMALTSLPLLAVALAETLDGCCDIARRDWLWIFAAGLLILALAGGYLAWRRFRRRFVGLEETLEELREDIVWLREKVRRDAP